MEVTAIVLRATRDLSRHGLAKASWKLKERAKSALTERKDRIIIRHANDAEEVFEGTRNRAEEDTYTLIDCTWYVDFPPRLTCYLLKPTQFRSARVR